MLLSPPILWLIAGILLCLLEFAVPTAFVEFTMGISAIVVALFALIVPNFTLQVALWLLLSVVLTMLARHFVPQGKSSTIEDSKEAKTLTQIAPGQVGRVLYEGNSWQARCGDDEVTIAPNQKVYVLSRRGNTLIVMPES
jgi:membrane protein implicated in regulation of membrane protease activity